MNGVISGMNCNIWGWKDTINTIIVNSANGSSAASGDGSPILRCEYNSHNRPYECFIPEIQRGVGGGINIKSSSPEIMNNIIVFSIFLSPNSLHNPFRDFLDS